jgi:isocitrate dehydrogenase
MAATLTPSAAAAAFRPTPSRPVTTAITVAYGDGIGPEIMRACLRILHEAGAKLETETIEIGGCVYSRGITSGIGAAAWRALRQTGVLYKGPVATPHGGGVKSPSVTIRKTLGLYANVRPTVTYHPFVRTPHPGLDVVVIRENEEDLYAGIEHRQTDEVYQCLRIASRPGCERIVRYAFDFARRNGRRKVSCFTKDNILKMTDGLFRRVFTEVAAEYPDIEAEHLLVDVGAARLAKAPLEFDVIVLPNLYGDLLADIPAEMAGSVGLNGSANVGDRMAMFEAVHGSAPDIAGDGVANPSGLLHAGVLMLLHLGQTEVAERVRNAWLRTIEDGIHTADIYHPPVSQRCVGTDEFARAVIDRLGLAPQLLPRARYQDGLTLRAAPPLARPARAHKEMVGVDVFLDWHGGTAGELAERLRPAGDEKLPLSLITNRGVKVWPEGFEETFCTDHWRCRFYNGSVVTHAEVLALLGRLAARGFDFIKTENLYLFDGVPGYSLGQGQ